MLFIRVFKGVRDPSLGIDDNGTIDGSPKPRKMSMPKKGSLLMY